MSDRATIVDDPELGKRNTALSKSAIAAAFSTHRLDGCALSLLVLLPLLFIVGRAPAEIAMSLIALLLLIRSQFGLGWHWLKTAWVAGALGFWCYLLLASIFAISPADSFSRALPFVRFVLFAAALQHWLLTDARHLRLFLTSLAIAVGFVVLDCFYEYAMGHDLLGKVAEGAYRLSGPFNNDVAGAFIAKTSLPLIGWWFAWSAGKGRISWLAGGLLAVTIGATIMLTGERTALVTYGLGLFILVMSVRRIRLQLVTVGLLATIGAVSVIAANDDLKSRYVGHTMADVDDFWADRYGIIFVKAFKAWQDQPLTGVGLKNFRLTCETPNFKQQGPVESWCFTHPHNPYLEVLSETGMIGFLLFLLLLGLLFRDLVSGWRRQRLRPDFPLVVGASASLVLFFWPVMVSQSIFSNWNGMLLWLMIGLALATARPRAPSGYQPAGNPGSVV
jgi:O-antigen ligase